MIEQTVKELLEIADILCKEKNYNAALTKLNEVDRLDPGMPQSLTQRAHIFLATERAGDAVNIFKLLHQHFPNEADTLGELANATFFAGETGNAYELVAQALEMDPDSSYCLEVMGRIAPAAKRWDKAVKAFKKLSKIHPKNPRVYWLWSDVLFKVNEFEQAIKIYRKILDIEPLNYEHATNLGRFYFQARKFEEAEEWHKKALELKPGDDAVLVSLARCAIQAGDLAGGEKLVREALQSVPDSIYAFTLLNDLRPEETNQKTAGLLEEILEKDRFLDPIEKMHTCLFLGKFYHKEKRYNRAFKRFKKYNDLRHEGYQAAGEIYDSAVMEGNIKETKRIFSKQGLKKLEGVGLDSALLVFIVGMPRSGTTLLEQIIATHSKVFGAGEMRSMTRNFMDLNYAINEEPEKDIYDILRDETKGWIDYYMDALNAPKGVLRVTDKMPVNFIYLGMIQTMFPNARVIHIKRNPLDNCLSMYSNDFSETYAYTTKFNTLGHYYNLYADLMTHWKKTLNMKFMEIQYEDLVANQEQKSREVLEFCGLEWEDEVLEYYKAKKAAYTISQVQVTRPINTQGLARWKPYQEHIGELIDALDEDIVGKLGVR